MTQLDDRLTRLEKRVEEVHRLLVRLIELYEGSVQPVPAASNGGQRPAPLPETLISESYEEWFEQDPLEIQYELARIWSETDRNEDLTEFQLAGRNLRNVDLAGAQMLRANLARADLTGAKLSKANLSGSDLGKAQVVRVDLSRANLEEADLTFANLSYAKLEKANLRHAVMTRANLTGANLSGADLGGAQMNRVNLTRANLKNAAVTQRQLASVSSLDGATMPDGRLFDGDTEPFKRE